MKTLCLRRPGAWLFRGAEGVEVPSDKAKVHQRDSSHFKLDFETPRRNAPTQAKIYAEFYLPPKGPDVLGAVTNCNEMKAGIKESPG